MRRLSFILLFLNVFLSQTLLLELDYWSPSKKARVFKVSFLKGFMLSANTLGDFDSNS